MNKKIFPTIECPAAIPELITADVAFESAFGYAEKWSVAKIGHAPNQARHLRFKAGNTRRADKRRLSGQVIAPEAKATVAGDIRPRMNEAPPKASAQLLQFALI